MRACQLSPSASTALARVVPTRVRLEHRKTALGRPAGGRRHVCVRTAAPYVITTPTLTEEQQVKLKAYKVAVFSAQQYVRDFLEAPLTGAFPESIFVENQLNPQTAALASGADAVVAFVNDDLGEATLRKLAEGGVRMVAMRCAGYDRVDLDVAAKLGIKVGRVPTYSPNSVAEHAVALMFALNRQLSSSFERVRQGNYSLNGLVGFEMYNKTVAVVGTGAIGYQACRILKGIGCRVLAYDLYPSQAVRDLGIPYLSLEELLPQADIVTLHCPLLPSTRHLIDEKRLAQIKQGTMLINVSRGGLVKSEALFDALESGRLSAVGMDVYENEDQLFFKDFTSLQASERMKSWDRQFRALLTYPQVLVTPHSAFLTREALNNIADMTIKNLSAAALDAPLGSSEVKAQPGK